MQIMDKLARILTFCLIASLFIACEEDEQTTEPLAPYFGVAGNELIKEFVGESDTKYVTVSTNREFKAVSSDPTWCNVEIIDDKTDNLKITVSDNEKPKRRTAEITVSSSGFDNIVISVVQNWSATITTDKSYVLLTNKHLEFSLKIRSNIDYELELPSWISEKSSQADGTHIFTFTPISPGERSDNIIIKAKDEGSNVRVAVPVVHRERIKKIGSWLFDDPTNLVKATVGKDLQIVRNTAYNPDAQFLSVEGPSSTNKAVRIPVNCHFLADHGMVPKEGENYISEYTLFFEFKIPAVGRFYTFFQTNLNNNDDGEIFVRSAVPPTIGVGATGYAGGGLIKANEWHRLYLSFKPGDVKFFLGGEQFHSSTTNQARFRLDLTGVILCGGPWTKKDDNEFDIGEISIWNGALTIDDVKELEGVK